MRSEYTIATPCTLQNVTDVLIIGGGVIGLSTALRLREAGLDVRLWAADPPQETTSSVAAAIWYPYKAYPEDRVTAWGKRSYEVFEELSRNPDSGVRMREGVEIFHDPVSDPWWKDAVPDLRRCAPEELPRGYRDGYAFAVPVIEMPVYLDYLANQLSQGGVDIERRTISSLNEATGEAKVLVNCSGLGARDLLNDSSMMPIRGQVVRVSNPGIEKFTLDEENPAGVTYIVPRSGDCILGGTAIEGEWNTEPDPKTAEGILRRCIALEPILSEAIILEHKVGLRPGRTEVRLEAERLTDGTLCVHDYGHGGSGVTLSWGCAEEASGLVRRAVDG